LKSLLHQGKVILLHHPHEQDRKVPRDAVAPEPRLPECVLREDPGRGAQRAVLEEDARSELLVELRFLGRNAEMAQGDLHVRVGESERARRRGRVVILLRQRERRVPILGDARGE
jgi:hypothetical protein